MILIAVNLALSATALPPMVQRCSRPTTALGKFSILCHARRCGFDRRASRVSRKSSAPQHEVADSKIGIARACVSRKHHAAGKEGEHGPAEKRPRRAARLGYAGAADE